MRSQKVRGLVAGLAGRVGIHVVYWAVELAPVQMQKAGLLVAGLDERMGARIGY